MRNSRAREDLLNLSLIGLCALMGGSGVLHFMAPIPYERIIPTPLRPWGSPVVAVSGAFELLCAALLAIPQTRRMGSTATVILLVAVFPANIQMALDSLPGSRPNSRLRIALAWLRLPLQLPLVLWALSFRRVKPHASCKTLFKYL